MNAARQACRPKHQVLVLKCYPKFQKNNVEIRANSSELSYLLYYASTRRSKLQKVGDFLDKRTTADVWKGRIGNVQVTLEILKALIEKCPRDLPLFAGQVLRVLRTILKSDDVTMVEQSVPAFETLCAHQDPANLAADHDFITRYEEIVQLYAFFASKDALKSLKPAPSWPIAIKYRKAGLQALKAVASSESLGSETGRQLAVIIPAVLWNVYAESGDYLKRLEVREHEELEKEQFRRRQSISTVRTADEGEGDALAASATTEDADKLAEEEVGVIALQALKNIFVGVNRGQLRLATSAVLKFVGAHARTPQLEKQTGGWPTTLMAMICSWAPVQDRYAILVNTTETLVRSPIAEDDLERQLGLATIIDHLLSSVINFIGLSVMDVLVGLISHTLLLLQLGGPGSSVMPKHQQTMSVSPEKEMADPKSPDRASGVVMEIVKEPSPSRIQLLDTIQRCMASLATHVYYSDQISDMVSTIMSRLKPSSLSGVSNSAEAIEDPNGAINAVASSASLQERSPHVDRFFSFETGRLVALEAVKAIIITANTRRPDGSTASVSRSSVDVSVWEGTQWLLRDPSGKVRKAYVDALITWLNLELVKDDLKIVDNNRKRDKDNKGGLARRAVSNASHREKSPRRSKITFLPLLHLAIYESALHNTDSEADLLLLHLLLTTLVDKLGVNAVRTGLPMIWRLQEDIQAITSPSSKVRIGSLVHGYLWALSMALDFETSSVGRALHAEISRRNNKGLWVESIRVPPVPLDRIDTPQVVPAQLSTDVVHHEALKPFDNREALVDRIAEGYKSSLISPASSPPGSPSRTLSVSLVQPQSMKPPPSLPSQVREELLAEWTRDVCIAANTKDASSASVTGSRTGTSTHHKNNFLGVTIPNGGLESMNNSPLPSPRRAHSRPPSTSYGLVGRVASPHRNRSPSRTPGSTSSIHSAVRVEDLKRVLSGSAPRTSYSMRPLSHHHHQHSPVSSSSDSMVSVHSLSEASFVTADNAVHPEAKTPDSPFPPSAAFSPPSPTTTSPPRSHPTNAARERDAARSVDGVPPVPPIPASLRGKSVSPSGKDGHHQPIPAPSGGNGSIAVRKSRSLKRSDGGGRNGSGSRVRNRSNGNVDTPGLGGRGDSHKTPDFSGFLESISVGEDEDEYVVENGGGGHLGGLGKAPY